MDSLQIDLQWLHVRVCCLLDSDGNKVGSSFDVWPSASKDEWKAFLWDQARTMHDHKEFENKVLFWCILNQQKLCTCDHAKCIITSVTDWLVWVQHSNVSTWAMHVIPQLVVLAFLTDLHLQTMEVNVQSCLFPADSFILFSQQLKFSQKLHPLLEGNKFALFLRCMWNQRWGMSHAFKSLETTFHAGLSCLIRSDLLLISWIARFVTKIRQQQQMFFLSCQPLENNSYHVLLRVVVTSKRENLVVSSQADIHQTWWAESCLDCTMLKVTCLWSIFSKIRSFGTI